MKALSKHIVGVLLIVLSVGSIASPASAQDESGFITISGVVKDKQNKKRLEYVNITVPGSQTGTITNNDGEFTIKIKEIDKTKKIEISHLGYLNYQIPMIGKDMSDINIQLIPTTNVLEEVLVRARDPRYIVEEAISRIATNYSHKGHLFTGFYRETAQKRSRYINISEAVVDLYKTSYKERSVDRDRVQVLKGRKLLSQKASDTLAVKLLGGPNLSIYIDIVKNPDIILDPATLSDYSFKMEESAIIDNRPHYVISFQPEAIRPYPLHYGKLFIDKENLALNRAEFSLSMDDRNKATESILKKKPFGLRFKPLEVSFLVTYKQRGELSYLSYIRNEVRFKCDWKRKLFSTSYTIQSELVVTDGKEQDASIPYKMSFKQDQSLSDKVADFIDEDFWGAYNIIEPTESLETAVYKLKKQRK